MKKLLSAFLSAVLVLGMGTSSFAAAASKITGYKGTANTDIFLGDEIRPKNCKKDFVIAYFTPGNFEWSGTPKTANLTMSDLSAGKVKLKYKAKSGSKAISGVKLAIDKTDKTSASYGKPAILLTLNPALSSLKALDFEVLVYVYVQGQGSQNDYCFDITGTMENPVYEAEKGDTYGDMRDGCVIKFNSTCRNYEFELSDEMSIWGTGTIKKQYWAYADYNPTTQDETIMDKYPSIVESITLSTLGFTPELHTVKFHDLEPVTMYVYTVNSSGQLLALGKSNLAMPILSKYYLSHKEISGIKKYTPPAPASSSSSASAKK